MKRRLEVVDVLHADLRSYASDDVPGILIFKKNKTFLFKLITGIQVDWTQATEAITEHVSDIPLFDGK